MILVDEAQSIPIATLEQIRILSNLETAKEKLLQIVLVGQSELKDLLARPELRQLNQRISIRCELLPLSHRETAEYIRHRLKVASEGTAGVTFTDDGIKVIYDYSGGIPRLINLIGDRCLIAGLAGQTETINRKIAMQAVDNLELSQQGGAAASGVAKLRSWFNGTRVAIALALAVLLSGLLLWTFDRELLGRLLSRPLP
jgi:general secretion pathway protein A